MNNPIPYNKFILTPRPLNHLRDFVLGVMWNAVDKTLNVQIQETDKLEVIEWMHYIKKQQTERQKGPFVDLNKDALTMQLLNEADEELGCLKFKNVQLSGHSCYLARDTEAQNLVHELLLGYQEVEMTRKKEKDAVPFDTNTVADEEWRKDP